ncbi:hypothetical protein EDB85DRAFT_1954930 [Lactarius pseudohatsudake]|nr:hypothetical protein EDB85DRAFT_1954930 [Lactarius pseudohatsudake]
MTTPNMSSSWIETQYDPPDHADGSVREADHTPSMRTVYSVTPHHSHNSSRQTYTSGLYGPRPQPPPVDPIQGLPTPAMLEDPDAETMELDPGIDHDPVYESEYDDGHRSHGTRRSLRKIPRAMKRGFQPDRRGAQTSPSFVHHHQSPYHHPYTSDDLNAGPREQAGNPPYGVAVEHTEGDLRYSDDPNVTPALTPSAGPSRSVSHAIRAPRTESQPTYQSLTNPASRHVSHHGSLHNAQRSSPPRTVRNPDPASSTEEGSDSRTNGNSPRPSQYHAEPEHSPPGTSRISPLDRARRPTVTVQSPTGSPVYIEPQLADDYAGMDEPIEPPPEPSVPSQFARVGKFFRDLNSLPWVSPNVTVDFNPEDSGRGRHSAHPRHWQILVHRPPARPRPPRRRSWRATLAPGQGGSASSSEGASTHFPAPHVGLGIGPPPSSYPPYAVPQVALPSQPLYFFPAAYPQPPPPRGPGPSPNLADQTSPQSSGNSDPGVPRQPYFYVVAMPPAYVGGAVDPSRPMMPYGVPYPPPV